MRETKIKETKGYLGPYLHPGMLRPGDIQSMVFGPTDSGPFWMSPEEKEKRRHDGIVEGQFIKRKRTKKELTELLLAKNIQVKGRISSLQTAARNNGIPIEETMPKIIRAVGKGLDR